MFFFSKKLVLNFFSLLRKVSALCSWRRWWRIYVPNVWVYTFEGTRSVQDRHKRTTSMSCLNISIKLWIELKWVHWGFRCFFTNKWHRRKCLFAAKLCYNTGFSWMNCQFCPRLTTKLFAWLFIVVEVTTWIVTFF